MAPRGIDQSFIDEALRAAVAPATLANRNQLRVFRERENLPRHECVVENDLCLFEQACGTKRQQIDCARTGPNQINSARHDTPDAAAARRRNHGVRVFVN